MRIQVDFSWLERICKKLKAPERQFILKSTKLDPLSEIRINIKTGIEISISDVDVNEGGLLSYKGFHVVLYIKDHGFYLNKTKSEESGYRYHICDCDTLRKMKENKRFQRYVVTQNYDEKFLCSGFINDEYEEIIAHLKVCKTCLRKLNYNSYNTSYQKNNIFNEFKLSEFFSKYSSYFTELPKFDDRTIFGGYGEDWPQISENAKINAKYRCNSCQVDLSDSKHKYLLHVHHINGITNDHSQENLRVLCKDCHSKEYKHNLIFVSRTERQLINKLRNSQNKSDPTVSHGQSANTWTEIYSLSDPAVHGLLNMVSVTKKPAGIPIVGYELFKNGTVVSDPIELAWEEQKIAIVLRRDDPTAKVFREEQWTVLTPSEAMEYWFHI